MKRKRYAICGVSNRGLWMFMDSILNTYKRQAELVGMLDKDRSRLDGCNRTHKLSLPAYAPDDFDRMVRETRPDAIVVTCHDAMHHHYVIQAL
ncbi:MAG: Gfo/Idh/MocA family oxidoreductase, partial [Lentisphaerae bacterium]|nr:Gfo/Idh/MocA family oxidoreductase [Lentisphaerota bacterium]